MKRKKSLIFGLNVKMSPIMLRLQRLRAMGGGPSGNESMSKQK